MLSHTDAAITSARRGLGSGETEAVLMSKVCVITGGAGGMGLAAAKIVGQDRLVFINDIDQNALDEAATEL